MLVKELVYGIMDLAKLISDDTIINEGHVLFLCKHFRSLLIKKEQEKEKATTDMASEFEYQQVCLDLEKVPAIDGEPCTGGYYLRTRQEVPKILEGIQPRVYPIDFYQGINISFIPRDRMRYVGTNSFLRNIIYVSLGPDLHLYLKSSNPQFLYLEKLRVNAIFEDFDAAAGLLCDDDGSSAACDVLEGTFPIRDYLVPTLVEMVVKQIVGAAWRPADSVNNAADDLSDIATFIRRNMKNAFQKQVEA